MSIGAPLLRWIGSQVLAAILLLAGSSTQAVQAASVQRGLTFARIHCAQCHSIDRLSLSPLRDAPPFRTLGQRYPLENLEEALAEGIVTSHPSMPEFRLEPDQIGDLMAFLKSLQ